MDAIISGAHKTARLQASAMLQKLLRRFAHTALQVGVSEKSVHLASSARRPSICTLCTYASPKTVIVLQQNVVRVDSLVLGGFRAFVGELCSDASLHNSLPIRYRTYG